MNILLLHPKFHNNLLTFENSLRIISKKALHPPLGLLTVASILPKNWDKKLIDMNVDKLKKSDLIWADYVFISAISVQRDEVRRIVDICKKTNVKIVGGGTLFTFSHDEFKDIDHILINESEITLPRLIEDIKKNIAKHIYRTNKHPDITQSPVPSYELLNSKEYLARDIQYSRGCPNCCGFCNISTILGKKYRVKKKEQIIEELDNLYDLGFQGQIYFVDDNFIGNKKEIKENLLPAMIKWMTMKKYPFSFFTFASINLADDSELIEMMINAGFSTVFIGIESPNEDSLKECKKYVNLNRDLKESVKSIQRLGLEVNGGFILGFDSDTKSIFEETISFINDSDIIVPLIGILDVPRNTEVYERLENQNRIISNATGTNTDMVINFIPKMGTKELIEGYKRTIRSIYSPKPFYKRIKRVLNKYKFENKRIRMRNIKESKGLMKSLYVLGIEDKDRLQFWLLILWTIVRKPRYFGTVLKYAISGYHIKKSLSVCFSR